MPYTKQTWVNNGTSGGLAATSEANAERLGYMETGIETAQNTADEAEAGLASKIETLTYANAAPGTRFTLLYNGSSGFVDPVTSTVASSRPSSRTNIYFDLVGGDDTVVNPSWMILGDAREIEAGIP